MTSDFESALQEMLTSVAKEAAAEAIRQFRMEERQRQQDGESERLLLRSHEAAEQLAISTATLQRLTSSGELPCVRIGSSVRYNVEALREWIQQREVAANDDRPMRADAKVGTHERQIRDPNSTDKPELAQRIETVARNNKKAKPSSDSKSRKIDPKANRGSKKTARNAGGVESNRPSRRRQPKKVHGERCEERPRNPFDLLLEEIGVDRKNLPPLKNGDIRQVADVDIPTMHGWQYLNRELPEDALQRLREHFIQYRTGKPKPP